MTVSPSVSSGTRRGTQSPANSSQKSTDGRTSVLGRIGLGGVIQLTLAGLLCLANVIFYSILPIAGLGLLPFLFFGCVCLLTGLRDDLGLNS